MSILDYTVILMDIPINHRQHNNFIIVTTLDKTSGNNIKWNISSWPPAFILRPIKQKLMPNPHSYCFFACIVVYIFSVFKFYFEQELDATLNSHRLQLYIFLV